MRNGGKMVMQTAVHRTLDGRQVSFSGDLDLSELVTARVEIKAAGFLNEVLASSRESGMRWAAGLFQVDAYSEEFAMSGGTLRIGHSLVPDKSADHLSPGPS